MSADQKSCCSDKSKPVAMVKLPCLVCGQAGLLVETRTLKHQVRPEHLGAVEKTPFYFCRSSGCDVVYYSENGVVLSKADVRQRIGLKEASDPVPICYCFGFTEKMVFDEIHATGKCTIPQRIADEVKAGNCACEIRNPQGTCCLGNVNTALKKAMALRRSAGEIIA